LKKIYIINLALFLILNASQEDKKQIFMDKYLPKNKIEQFSISPEELRKNSKDFNLNDIKTNIEMHKKDFNKKYGAIKNVKNKKAEEEAKKLSDYAKSNKFQKGVKKTEKYILYDKSINWSKYTGKYNKQTKEIMEQLEKTNNPLLSNNKFLEPNEKLFIIISSSLEKETIRNYFKILKNVNTDVTFVLRGLIGTPKKIRPTLNYINDLLTKDKNKDSANGANRYLFSVEINPKITRRFNIKEVPAVLFIKNYNPVVEEYKSIIGHPDENEFYYVAYGEVSVDYALKQINRRAKSNGIERLLKGMKESFYK